VTAPNPVRNDELMRITRAVLHRPPIPARAIKTVPHKAAPRGEDEARGARRKQLVAAGPRVALFAPRGVVGKRERVVRGDARAAYRVAAGLRRRRAVRAGVTWTPGYDGWVRYDDPDRSLRQRASLFADDDGRRATVAHLHGVRTTLGKGDTPQRHRQAEQVAELVSRVRGPDCPGSGDG